MAVDSLMIFVPYKGSPLTAESQLVLKGSAGSEPCATDGGFNMKSYVSAKQIFEVEDYSFDVEQTINMSSQATGAGAGKITFNPFSITRRIDVSSPTLFQMCCMGTTFKQVYLLLRKSAGDDSSGLVFLRYDFKLVAIKTISWSHDDESPKETMTFEYGGLQIRYSQQKPDGSMDKAIGAGWDKIHNHSDVSADPIS